LLLPPFYYKNPTEDGLFAYFSEVINRVGSGIKYYLYNFPQQSAVPLSVELIGRLLKAFPGTLKGVKDSSGNYDNGRAYVENFAKDGFEVYAGDDTLLRPLLLVGSAGCITAAANVNSPIAAQVYANYNSDVGVQAHETLSATRRAIVSAPAAIPALKALMARHTGDAGWLNMRPPHLKLTGEQQAKLFAAFDASGVQLAKAA
jgi:4-hydroxy-tetrahydrodipicolinate synthase